MSVKLQRLLILMTAIMMALVTFTACDEDENGEDDPNGNGGVSGKRVKSTLSTCSAPGYVNFRTDITYNSDGTVKRTDTYDPTSSKLLWYCIVTSNSNGTTAKSVLYDQINVGTTLEETFFYNSDKTIQKIQSDTFKDGVKAGTVIWEFTYAYGKKIRQTYHTEGSSDLGEIIFNYDAGGRRTTSVTTYYYDGGRQSPTITHTRTYNADGTVQKVTYPYGYDGDSQMITYEYTWENGKTTMDFDMGEPW